MWQTEVNLRAEKAILILTVKSAKIWKWIGKKIGIIWKTTTYLGLRPTF